MAQCVEALVASDRRAEREYRYRLSRIGRFVNTIMMKRWRTCSDLLRTTTGDANVILPHLCGYLPSCNCVPQARTILWPVYHGAVSTKDLDDDKAFDEMSASSSAMEKRTSDQEMPWPIDDPGASIKGTAQKLLGQAQSAYQPEGRMVGRPQKQKKTTFASERTDRKWYKAAEKGRATAGSDTLEHFWTLSTKLNLD
ncbi:hypothetical protein GQ600_4465 [Phytophthora cactorum]|nr:hypothetical protein GQ600_4465 [Phytophthora cactorum]